MSEFLDSTSGLPDSTRRVASHLVSVPYESSVNWAFASALGAYGEAGRRFRAAKVSDKVEQWAERNAISLQTEDDPSPDAGTSPTTTGDTGLPSASETTTEDLRKSLQSAIMLMSPTELAQVLVPATVCARLGRMRSGE